MPAADPPAALERPTQRVYIYISTSPTHAPQVSVSAVRARHVSSLVVCLPYVRIERGGAAGAKTIII